LKALREMYKNNNLFGIEERDGAFFVNYSGRSLVKVSVSSESILIEPTIDGIDIEAEDLDLHSETVTDEINTMYQAVMATQGYSFATASSKFNINARAAPPHRMDNPKIAALDIEIKRSKNKLKYMEAQLFPNGLPAAKQP
jgi:chaperonin GroEL (HSP60 family)